MNHLPFEEWLLNEASVTPEQQRELDLHLRTCAYCSALVETERMLGTMKLAEPMPGFSARFQSRLVQRKVEERRRKLWGAFLFTLGGLALLMWAIGPYVTSFFASPATWISAVVSWLIFIGTTLRALLDAGSVILKIVPNFLSPFVWLVLISTFAGAGLLSSVSIWRFVRVPQGV